MEAYKLVTSTLLLSLGFLALMMPKLEGQIILPPPFVPRPLCSSQFALAGYACSLVPVRSSPPPSPPPNPLPPPSNESSTIQGRHHHHHHHHSRREQPRPRPTPEEQNCCRWLEQMDDECVCHVLFHLPNFLAGPVHMYTVIVGNVCSVSFTCGGRPFIISP